MTEKVQIVNECMARVIHEAQLRPRAAMWNEFAYDSLPEDVLDKLVVATDADGVLEAVSEYALPEMVEKFKDTFRDNQRAVDWVVKGLNEIKEWYAEEGPGGRSEEAAEEEAPQPS